MVPVPFEATRHDQHSDARGERYHPRSCRSTAQQWNPLCKKKCPSDPAAVQSAKSRPSDPAAGRNTKNSPSAPSAAWCNYLTPRPTGPKWRTSATPKSDHSAGFNLWTSHGSTGRGPAKSESAGDPYPCQYP